MSAYVIADMDPADEQKFQEYGLKASEVTRRYGGQVIVVGGEPEVLEGRWKPHFVMIIVFPGMADLRRWYDSHEYQALIPLRRIASRSSDFVAVEGVRSAGGSPPSRPS